MDCPPDPKHMDSIAFHSGPKHQPLTSSLPMMMMVVQSCHQKSLLTAIAAVAVVFAVVADHHTSFPEMVAVVLVLVPRTTSLPNAMTVEAVAAGHTSSLAAAVVAVVAASSSYQEHS